MMYAVKWNATVLRKAWYAMENPTCVTDRFCRAMLFVTAGEAEEFKEKNYLEQFTVFDISLEGDKILTEFNSEINVPILYYWKDQIMDEGLQAMYLKRLIERVRGAKHD